MPYNLISQGGKVSVGAPVMPDSVGTEELALGDTDGAVEVPFSIEGAMLAFNNEGAMLAFNTDGAVLPFSIEGATLALTKGVGTTVALEVPLSVSLGAREIVGRVVSLVNDGVKVGSTTVGTFEVRPEGLGVKPPRKTGVLKLVGTGVLPSENII
jgi:hypothetical protein